MHIIVDHQNTQCKQKILRVIYQTTNSILMHLLVIYRWNICRLTQLISAAKHMAIENTPVGCPYVHCFSDNNLKNPSSVLIDLIAENKNTKSKKTPLEAFHNQQSISLNTYTRFINTKYVGLHISVVQQKTQSWKTHQSGVCLFK